MITKYRANFGRVERIDVESETNNFVVISGRREAKITDWRSYFDSFEEAKKFLLDGANKRVETAKARLHYAMQEAEMMEALTNTQPPA